MRASPFAARLLAIWLGLAGLVPAATGHAQGQCVTESECSFLKPNVLILLDYSSSMVGFQRMPNYYPEGQFSVTRWDAQLEALRWILGYDEGVFPNNMRLGLARFGHDPDTENSGTTLVTDTSFPPITDGFALDVPFEDTDGEYFECLGSAVTGEVALLSTTPPPWVGLPPAVDTTMATWTRGALRSAHQVITKTREQHAEAAGEADRSYHVVIMTDGEWTCADQFGQACDEDPAPEAAALLDDGIAVHVVGFGEGAGLASLDELARQGGTGDAVDARSPRQLMDALTGILDDIRNSVIVPECIAGLPRVMLVMDGSSSMLVGDGPGETNWDKARYALAGNPDAPNPDDPGYVESIFRRQVDVAGKPVTIEDVTHVGLLAFAEADRQALMVPFAPCARDNIAWSMDPQTSCVNPDCNDPYAGPPLTWTFQQSGTDGNPSFRQATQSFMPPCNSSNDGSCRGTGPSTFTGEGLGFAIATIEEYRMNPEPFGVHDETPFINILITDGETSEDSRGAQDNLERLVALGVNTYVIGFGSPDDLDEAELDQFAVWGNTDTPFIVDPEDGDSADGLASAIATIVAGLGLDPCCAINDCALDPEPPDPPPVCGDGVVEGDEACDDGNRARHDDCDPSCRIERPLIDFDENDDDDAGSDEQPDRTATVDPAPSDPSQKGDAGMFDAGTRPASSVDASVVDGAGAGSGQPSIREGSCSCGVPGPPAGGGKPLGLLLAIGAWLARRRKVAQGRRQRLSGPTG